MTVAQQPGHIRIRRPELFEELTDTYCIVRTHYRSNVGT